MSDRFIILYQDYASWLESGGGRDGGSMAHQIQVYVYSFTFVHASRFPETPPPLLYTGFAGILSLILCSRPHTRVIIFALVSSSRYFFFCFYIIIFFAFVFPCYCYYYILPNPPASSKSHLMARQLSG